MCTQYEVLVYGCKCEWVDVTKTCEHPRKGCKRTERGGSTKWHCPECRGKKLIHEDGRKRSSCGSTKGSDSGSSRNSSSLTSSNTSSGKGSSSSKSSNDFQFKVSAKHKAVEGWVRYAKPTDATSGKYRRESIRHSDREARKALAVLGPASRRRHLASGRNKRDDGEESDDESLTSSDEGDVHDEADDTDADEAEAEAGDDDDDDDDSVDEDNDPGTREGNEENPAQPARSSTKINIVALQSVIQP